MGTSPAEGQTSSRNTSRSPAENAVRDVFAVELRIIVEKDLTVSPVLLISAPTSAGGVSRPNLGPGVMNSLPGAAVNAAVTV